MSDHPHLQGRDRQQDTHSTQAHPLGLPAAMLWPLSAAASVSQATAAALDLMVVALTGKNNESPLPPDWVTPNAVRLELPSMQLRDFSMDATDMDSAEPATLVCAPFAFHRSTVADFATGYSLVETLMDAGLRRLFVTDWRSATAEMSNFSIDTYLADLNVAVDDLKSPVNLIGLCQGGWLALLYAARFPQKVNRLVLAGAPVDIAAAPSPLAQFVAATPHAAFESLVRAGDGRVMGQQLLNAWGPLLAATEIGEVLQMPDSGDPHAARALEARFRHWHAATVDLPGPYYMQVIRHLFQENQIAGNRFMALGRRVDLGDIKIPTCLLAGRDDELVPPDQLLATRHLIGTSPDDIVTLVEPCRHLSLFMGAKTLTTAWRQIAGWLTPEIRSRAHVA